jgi:hypothetical protein
MADPTPIPFRRAALETPAAPPAPAPRPASTAPGSASPGEQDPGDLVAFVRGLPDTARGAFTPFFTGLVVGWILGSVSVALGLALAVSAGAFS